MSNCGQHKCKGNHDCGSCVKTLDKKAIIDKMWEIHRNSENLEQCWNAIFESIIKPMQGE